MADEKFSDFDPAQLSNDADQYPLLQSAQNRLQTLAQLKVALGVSSPNILAFSALVGAADKLAYFTGAGAMSLTTLSAFMRTLLDDADALSARTTLGVLNVGKGYIEGLALQWVIGNAITVSTGAAYLNGAIVSVDTPIATTGMVLTASTWYHAYLYLNSGVPAIEFSTTAPDAPYFGSARLKTGDASRRYLGSIKTLAANTVIRFVQSGTRVNWLMSIDLAPLGVLTNGQAVSAANVSLAGAVPSTATIASTTISTPGAGSAVLAVSNPDAGPASSSFFQLAIGAALAVTADLSLGAAQTISYAFNSTPGSGGAYIRVSGYTFGR